MARTFVDRGGTFTDVVHLHEDGRVEVRKIPSDRAVVGELARGELVFGTTVATNALLERTGVPTLLVVTRGLEDLVRIGDMTRPALFEPELRRPEPMCARIAGIPGRIAADGTEIEPLAELDTLDLDGVEAVAVALLNSHRNPRHEVAVAARIRARRPDLFVALGSEASPELGYLSRIETTLVDAAITPVLQRALERDRIGPRARAIRSDGGLTPALRLRAPDAVLSGPAGGVLAVAAVASRGGFQRAVGLDMGGTSTDVCRVDENGLPRREGDVVVAGTRLRRPMLEVDTIAAGGGSILWSDGIRLGVGPRSAGADPGPQCYGRGGPPTLTDAALELGLVDPDAFVPALDPTRVDLPGPAQAFVDLARDQMAAAIRRLALSRGVDLADHALVAFGGAAGAHAADVADRLGISTVLVHPCASVLSAFGQILAREEADAVRALWVPLREGWGALEAAWRELEAELPNLGEVERTAELRHQGTDHAIEIRAATADEARAAFTAEHRRRYGFDRDGEIEIVNARVRVRAEPDPVPAVEADPWSLEGPVEGPRTLHAPTTSIRVPEGWRARFVDGLLRLERTAPADRPSPTERTPYGIALWGHRFMAVAEQAGSVLQRLARSVNIRERLDFSCAIFDGSGHLVANAPHIPVHLGAMGATVRDLIARVDPLPAGQAWLCNDPEAGGSHLPDLTVVTCIELDGHRFFAACRGHHVDVGGDTPGSMPPHSTRLDQEGFVVRHLPLLIDGGLASIEESLVGCRAVDTVRADLEAQIAANAHAARALAELGPPATLTAWMAHLQDAADASMGRVLAALPDATEPVTDRIGGIALQLQLRREGDRLVVDFAGTGGPHRGNLNAPSAVVRASVLCALRILAREPIPLNEGTTRRVDLRIPSPSLLDPPTGAAVAGGNVETSQRLVDLVLRAAGFLAASAGTMSNLTLGGQRWSLYETIGAGQGASPRADGPSGRQIHMTNTRATDPEVLEARLPLRLRRFALRTGSGGSGTHRGGDGLEREIELLEPGTASLLATRRDLGAPGTDGGGPGAPGEDSVDEGSGWIPWNGSAIALDAGAIVRVRTPGGGGWGSSEP